MDNAFAMKVKVRLFAIARERAGVQETWLVAPTDATVAQVLAQLGQQFPKLPPILQRAMVAVNREYVDRDHVLSDSDEVAVIPPVSGGAQ